MRIHPLAMSVPLLVLTLAGCDDWDGGLWARYRQDFHYTYPLAPGGSLRLENYNGSVEISGWDRDTVDIDGTKFAHTERRLQEVKVDVAPAADSITVRTIRPPDRYGDFGAQYVIHVPRRADLTSILNSNARIQVDNINGRAFLRTSNGSVHAVQMQGSLDIQTSNGSIEVSGMTGDTSLRTSNGFIHAEVRQGGFEARTSNARIEARLTDQDSKPVRLENSNGRIEITMDAAREVRADTSNSSITVWMPPSAAVNIRAQTRNASIRSDFMVSSHGILSKQRLDGAIGAGGPLLDLTTSNGSIRLLKR